MKSTLKMFSAPALLLATVPAMAHVGGEHAHSFADGVLHPVTGWDHALVALVVGLIVGQVFAAQTRQASGTRLAGTPGAVAPVWRLPVLFLGGMTLGMTAGVLFAFGGWIEQGITLSLIAAGMLLMVARAVVTSGLAVTAVGVVIFSGAAHGVVHAVEGGFVPGYLVGILAGTALLHAAGIAMGRAFSESKLLLRAAGVLTAGAGMAVWLS